MNGRGLFTCFLASCFLLSCSSEKPTLPTKSQPNPSVELPIGYRQLLEWDVPSASGGQGNGVQGIAVDNEGRVFVADSEGQRILVYSSDGKLQKTFEPNARHAKILQRPFGLLLDGHDHLYVTDYDADQIQVFSTEGKYLFAWGREGNGKAQFRAPVAIDQDRQGNLYVVEFYGMRVQKFTHEGKFLLTWGSQAPWGKLAPPEQLLYPSGLTVGPDGNIYVTDSGHDRIKVFNPEGRLHESDAANQRVQMFTPEGRFLGEWFLPNAGNLNVWSPANVRAVGSQFLYVSDVAENRI